MGQGAMAGSREEEVTGGVAEAGMASRPVATGVVAMGRLGRSLWGPGTAHLLHSTGDAARPRPALHHRGAGRRQEAVTASRPHTRRAQEATEAAAAVVTPAALTGLRVAMARRPAATRGVAVHLQAHPCLRPTSMGKAGAGAAMGALQPLLLAGTGAGPRTSTMACGPWHPAEVLPLGAGGRERRRRRATATIRMPRCSGPGAGASAQRVGWAVCARPRSGRSRRLGCFCIC